MRHVARVGFCDRKRGLLSAERQTLRSDELRGHRQFRRANGGCSLYAMRCCLPGAIWQHCLDDRHASVALSLPVPPSAARHEPIGRSCWSMQAAAPALAPWRACGTVSPAVHLEMTMLTRRMIATLLIAGASAASGPAMGQGKVIVYTSNDSNLNRFTFEAFKKETGIEVEPVEAGSGVILRRMASERERPLGD